MKSQQLTGRAVSLALALVFIVSVSQPAVSAPPATATPAKTTVSAQAKPPTTAGAKAAKPATPPAVVATVGTRSVDALDIQRAAESLANDPLRKKDPQAWRKSLLALCADRELLAADAEARGVGKDPAVQARWADRQYAILFGALYQKVLEPGIEPTAELLDSLRAGGLYRGVDLNYILIRDTEAGRNKAMAQKVYEHLKAGARFDSLARIYSGHPPSAAAGGHFGWVLGRDLDPQSYPDFRTAKAGDILGVYSSSFGHEIYGVVQIQELSPDSLYRLVLFERGRGVYQDYDTQILQKYHFSLDQSQVNSVLFTMSMESPDSIMQSLGPDGTRPEVGSRPALGVIARCDGDSVTVADIIRTAPLAYGSQGRIHIRNAEALQELCGRALLHSLIVRDAKERGIDKDPVVARALRLAREQILTDAMVIQARPAAPDGAALRAFLQKNADRYRRPAVTVAAAAVFASPESVVSALSDWHGQPLTDTLFASRRLAPQKGATATTLYPGWYATLTVSEGSQDSLSRAITALNLGERTGIVRTIQGYAVAEARSREPARPMTFEEAEGVVTRDWWGETDNNWIVKELERLRAATPVRVVPGRLEAVKLTPAKIPQGGAR